jgi:hypothetical protein
MRRIIIFLFISLLSSACTRTASEALPTEPALDFPTPSVDALPACTSPDLLTSASSNEAGDAITLGVTFTNKSGNLCTLANPPEIVLLDANDRPIKARINQLPNEMTPPAPAVFVLAPNDSVIASLVWQNYCQVLPGSMLSIQLTLTKNKTVNVAVKLSTEPHCNNKNEPSTLMVAPYSNPP